MLSLQAMADEMEREKARQRTLDAMLQKDRAGFVTAERSSGTTTCGSPGATSNVGSTTAKPRSYGGIFEMAAFGHSSRHIAHVLNGL
jgi:hypothetical protein